ncbi:Mitotic checkpoint serine/threonine-protein kinase BUB1 beta [Schistosoma japonicum]|nr:Mitotic checkpoint serine/threonine-protein kinase BUB1 beta [Schistosoma japonicum]
MLNKYFELQLASLSASNQKFRLYSRYIKWIEENYPSLGRSADLQNVLYRCIRDSSELPGIKNNDIYVGHWIKLTEYCDEPNELFELLFRQGVGTMCSEFYITWCQLLEKYKHYQKIASIYAHGLRAGAKPLLWLEDRAEAFLHRYQNYLKCTVTPSDTIDTFIANSSCNENQNENTRKKLASLRLIETGAQENKLFAPVLRTKEMWHANQSGLGVAQSSQPTSNKCIFRIKQDNSSDENSVLLRDLPVINENSALQFLDNKTSDFIRPVGIPSSWKKENEQEPGPWNKAQITTTRTVSSLSRPVGPPNWQIFTEDQGEKQQTDSSNIMSAAQHPTVCTKPKGLKVKSLKDDDSPQQSSEISFIAIASFNRLLHHDDQSQSLPNDANSLSIKQNDALLTKLNLPSLPGDKLPEVDCFACDISLIYGGIEELCWEMHRSVKWDNNHTKQFDNSSIEHNQNLLNNCWDMEELQLINEINTIIHNDDDDERINTFQSNDQLAKSQYVESTRRTLIKSLEDIALN